MEQLTPIDYAYVNGDKWEYIGIGEPMPIFTYNKNTNEYLAGIYKERQLSDPLKCRRMYRSMSGQGRWKLTLEMRLSWPKRMERRV